MEMKSKAFLIFTLLLAVFLLTSSAVSAVDPEKNVEAAEKAKQVTEASGCGYVINKRGRIAQSLSCRHGCCSWGPRKLCRRCCSSAEEALSHMKNEPHA